MLDQDLLNVLACPSCKGDVKEQEGKIVCCECGLKYPIRENIPIMLIDEADK